MTLGEQVRAAREAKRMTLRALASRMDVSAVFLCDVEKDRRTLSDDRRDQVAKILGIDKTLLDAACGYSRDIAGWLRDRPEVVQLLRESRRTGQPLRIGGEHCRCCTGLRRKACP